MRKKGFKLLALSLFLSMSIGGTVKAVEATPPLLTRQQQHVVKTYNGQPQGEPVQTQVSYINGLEIIRYEGLPDVVGMSAISDTYFYVKDERYFNDISRIMDRYGNIFCQEKMISRDVWEIRTNRTGLQYDSFILRKSIGNGADIYYWYSKDGDLLAQLPGVFGGENSKCSVYDMNENVLIIQEALLDERILRYNYYDMENGFKLIASFDAGWIFTSVAPAIKNGYCYLKPEDRMTVYDDSRIKFGSAGLDGARRIDDSFIPHVRRLLNEDTPSIYAPDTGWLLGEGGQYGFQAYNVKTGEMVNITPWEDQPSGSYFCYWWENENTNYPYEFEKDGLMLLSVADKENPGWNHTVVYDLNARKLVNNQVYESLYLPDYKERPMLYTQDPDHWYGYLNDNFVPMAIYADATTFSNGYALVSHDKKTYSIINENLEVVVPNAFAANVATNMGHGLFELGYSSPDDPYNYTSYKYVYIGPQYE